MTVEVANVSVPERVAHWLLDVAGPTTRLCLYAEGVDFEAWCVLDTLAPAMAGLTGDVFALTSEPCERVQVVRGDDLHLVVCRG